jgi:hypothetical protein
MKERTRTRERWASNGAILIPPELAGGPYPYRELFWTCTDFVEKKKDPVTGRTPPSDLTLMKVDIIPPFLSNKLVFAIWGITYYHEVNVPCYAPSGLIPSTPPLGWSYIEGTDAELTAELLAKSNPFRYEVSVPVMIAELVEAGSLLKLASNNFLSLIGSQHLNYVFGWEATKRDIKALADITMSIERRIREFNDLVTKGGIRRRINLASGSDNASEYTYPVRSNGQGVWYANVNSTYHSKVWGTVRWVPNRTSPIDLSKLTSFNEAMKIVLDLRKPDASTIWEAIPFSWLVDYFLNVGDTLQALEDTDKVLPTEVCLMRHRTVITTAVGTGLESPGGYPWSRDESMSSGKVTYDIKLRKVVEPDHLGDLLSFGIMSKGQATNLIALLLSLARFKK